MQIVRIPRWIACVAMISVLGCSGGAPDDQPALGTVTGTVTLDGQPLADVVVSFEPQGGGRPSVGKTDASGKYELGYNADEKGAAVGTHLVTVTTPTDAPSPTGEAPEDPIPAKYNTDSTLTKEVKAGDNTIDLELTSS